MITTCSRPPPNPPTDPACSAIQEVAAELGLTPRSIRYYEEIGLLAPPPGRTAPTACTTPTTRAAALHQGPPRRRRVQPRRDRPAPRGRDGPGSQPRALPRVAGPVGATDDRRGRAGPGRPPGRHPARQGEPDRADDRGRDDPARPTWRPISPRSRPRRPVTPRPPPSTTGSPTPTPITPTPGRPRPIRRPPGRAVRPEAPGDGPRREPRPDGRRARRPARAAPSQLPAVLVRPARLARRDLDAEHRRGLAGPDPDRQPADARRRDRRPVRPDPDLRPVRRDRRRQPAEAADARSPPRRSR